MSIPKSYRMLQRVSSIITILVMVLSLFNGTVRSVQAASTDSHVSAANVTASTAPASNVSADSSGPTIETSGSGSWIHGWGWPDGATVELTVDDLSNGPGVDHTFSSTVGPMPWNPDDPNRVAVFDTSPYRLKPDDTLTITDHVTPHSMIIDNLQIAEINLDADTITGTTIANAPVQVCVNDKSGCVFRHVSSTEFGAWSVNYHEEGSGDDTPGTFDIKAGMNGWAKVENSVGDQSYFDWDIPNPYIEGSISGNWVKARGWPVGNELTLTIAGTEFSANATVEHNPDNPGDPNDIRAEFTLGDLQLQTGMLLTVADETASRTLTLTSLAISNIDVEADTISGTTIPLPGYAYA